MKKFLFIAGIFFLTAQAFAGTTVLTKRPALLNSIPPNDTPPQIVLGNFHSSFGNVPVRTRKRGSSREWIAVFIYNNRPWQATFGSNGALIKSGSAF